MGWRSQQEKKGRSLGQKIVFSPFFSSFFICSIILRAERVERAARRRSSKAMSYSIAMHHFTCSRLIGSALHHQMGPNGEYATHLFSEQMDAADTIETAATK